MMTKYATIFYVGLVGLSFGSPIFADDVKSGEHVYQLTCFACHGTGVAKAPQLNDKKAWAPLIKEGQDALTAHGWVGIRGMPAKGGNPNLSLEEFARATAYMARSGGANWQDPDEAMMQRIRAEETKRLQRLKKK